MEQILQTLMTLVQQLVALVGSANAGGATGGLNLEGLMQTIQGLIGSAGGNADAAGIMAAITQLFSKIDLNSLMAMVQKILAQVSTMG
ncbi:MAG: hypothetical protein K6F64_02130 [Clostridia bacterium]|nr:hypothetical protein [Clostridia bacterium]